MIIFSSSSSEISRGIGSTWWLPYLLVLVVVVVVMVGLLLLGVGFVEFRVTVWKSVSISSMMRSSISSSSCCCCGGGGGGAGGSWRSSSSSSEEQTTRRRLLGIFLCVFFCLGSLSLQFCFLCILKRRKQFGLNIGLVKIG